MSEELATWLLKQIDQDEALARGTDASSTDFYGAPTTLEESWHTRHCGYAQGEMLEPCGCDVPARVLAECAAKRRVIALHSTRSGTGGGWDTDPPAICNEDNDVHPCDTLCLLAAPYSDRPTYRDEWRMR